MKLHLSPLLAAHLCLLGLPTAAISIPASVLSDSALLTVNANVSEGPLTNAAYWTSQSGVTAVAPILQSDPHGPNPAAADFSYYIPAGRQLPLYRAANSYMKPWTSGTVVMGGAALHLAGTYNPRTDYIFAPFCVANLYLYDGSHASANNGDQGFRDVSVHVRSDVGKEFSVTLAPDADKVTRRFTFERCRFTGDLGTGVVFVQSDVRPAGTPNASELRLLDCDLEAFNGRLSIVNDAAAWLAGKVLVTGTQAFPGELALGDNMTLTLEAGATLEVGTLALGTCAMLDFRDVSDSGSSRMIVTTRLTRPSEKRIRISCDWASDVSFTQRIPLVTVAANAGDITERDFVPVSQNIGSLEVETLQDGSKILFARRSVQMVTTDNDANAPYALAAGGGAHWANGLPVQNGFSYYIPGGKILRLRSDDVGNDFLFPGDSLTLAAELAIDGSPRSLTVPKFRILPANTINMYNSSLFSFKSPNPIEILSRSGNGSEELIFHFYGSNTGETFNIGTSVDAEIEGDANIGLRWRGKDVSFGHIAFRGLNTNFTGKVRLFCNPNPADYMPFGQKFGTLWVSDQRNLGGPIPGATTPVFDALTVTDRQVLRTTQDVTFDEPTRGIYVPFGARFRIDAGQTLAIRQQLTYAGTLEKTGAGVLALGGSARFTANTLESPYADGTFLSGTNVLAICAGALKPLSAAAFAGVAVVMSNGTSLVLDPVPEDAVLAKFGIRAFAAGSSVRVPDGQVAVKLTHEPADGHTVSIPVATFAMQEEAEAFRTRLTFVRQWPGWQTELTVCTVDDDGTARHAVMATCRNGGLSIIFR